MSDTTELMNSLRDIQEPLPPESSTPWLLALIALIIVALTVAAMVLAFNRRKKVNRELQRELQTIQLKQPATALVQIAIVLRRAMHHIHGDKTNQLEGQPWLHALDKTFRTNYFTQGKGAILGTALYNAPTGNQLDTHALCTDISKLIGKRRLNRVALTQ